MAGMDGRVTNCARFREQMPDAVSASLSGGFLAAFDAHLRDCAACRAEFRRVQTSVQKIDRTLSANLAVEPPAQLVANVRKNILQDVNAQPHGAAAWRQWSAWVTAAGVCAAFAVLLFVARTSRKFNRPIHDSVAIHTRGSSTSLDAHPRLNADTEVAVSQPRKTALARARHSSLRAPHAIAGEPEITKPEIIVEPGQMQAILRFAAAMQRGQIDGAKLLADQKNAAQPLEVKPLTITPLEIKPLDDSAAAGSDTGGNLEKGFVAERSD